MYVFEVENNKLVISEHAYMISPFKEILERDVSERKDQAKKELMFIDMMCSLKSSNIFMGYVDDNERKDHVTKELWGTVDAWQPDQLIIDGMKAYIRFQSDASPTVQIWRSARMALNKLMKFFSSVDMTDRTNSGAAVYKPKDISNALMDVDKVSTELQKLETKLYTELKESGKNSGDYVPGLFEDQ